MKTTTTEPTELPPKPKFTANDGKGFEDLSDLHLYEKSKMTQGVYLYGEKIRGLSKMRNEDAYMLKMKLSRKLLKKLLEVSYMVADTARIGETLDSQKYNQKLLDEMHENDRDDLGYHLDDQNEGW